MPAADTTGRRTPLLAFSRFLETHAHLLTTMPREMVPIARNYARDGPVAPRAAARAETLTRPWLARDPRPELTQRSACLRTLTGHGGAVQAVALSRDGDIAVSGGEDRVLRVWDVTTGTCRAALEGHTAAVRDVAIDPEGSTAVSASKDQTLRLWDLRAGSLLRTLPTELLSPSGLAVTSDFTRAVLGGGEKLQVWDLAAGMLIRELQGRSDELNAALTAAAEGWAMMGGGALPDVPTAVAMTPDGRLAVASGNDGLTEVLRVWDLETGRCAREMKAVWAIRCLAVSGDGETIVHDHGDMLDVWDVPAVTCVRSLGVFHNADPALGHVDKILAVALSDDGSLAISASTDRTLRLWEVATARCLRVLHGHTAPVTDVALSVESSLAISASEDGTLRIWDLSADPDPEPLERHVGLPTGIALVADGARAVSYFGDLDLWKLRDSVPALAKAPTHRLGGIVWPEEFTTPRVWDTASGTCRGMLRGHRAPVVALALSPEGRTAMTVDPGPIHHLEETVLVWELASQTRKHRLQSSDDAAITRGEYAIAIRPDGRHALIASSRRRRKEDAEHLVREWDLSTGRCVRELQGHAHPVTSIAISPDGHYAVTADAEGYRRSGDTLRLWHLDSATCIRILDGTEESFSGLVFTPDGGALVWSSGTLRVWEVVGGDGPRGIGDGQGIERFALTPDGRTAVAATTLGSLEVWDLASGSLLHAMTAHAPARIRGLAVSADSRLVLSASTDSTLRVWNLASGTCEAIYPTGGPLMALSRIHANGRLVAGAHDGEMHFLTLRDARAKTPLVTAVAVTPGSSADLLHARCPWCASIFAVGPPVLEAIYESDSDLRRDTTRPPCFAVTVLHRDDMRLTSSCTNCRRTVRFNPFLALSPSA